MSTELAYLDGLATDLVNHLDAAREAELDANGRSLLWQGLVSTLHNARSLNSQIELLQDIAEQVVPVPPVVVEPEPVEPPATGLLAPSRLPTARLDRPLTLPMPPQIVAGHPDGVTIEGSVVTAGNGLSVTLPKHQPHEHPPVEIRLADYGGKFDLNFSTLPALQTGQWLKIVGPGEFTTSARIGGLHLWVQNVTVRGSISAKDSPDTSPMIFAEDSEFISEDYTSDAPTSIGVGRRSFFHRCVSRGYKNGFMYAGAVIDCRVYDAGEDGFKNVDLVDGLTLEDIGMLFGRKWDWTESINQRIAPFTLDENIRKWETGAVKALFDAMTEADVAELDVLHPGLWAKLQVATPTSRDIKALVEIHSSHPDVGQETSASVDMIWSNITAVKNIRGMGLNPGIESRRMWMENTLVRINDGQPSGTPNGGVGGIHLDIYVKNSVAEGGQSPFRETGYKAGAVTLWTGVVIGPAEHISQYSDKPELAEVTFLP